MPGRVGLAIGWRSALTASVLVLATGCGGFFPPLTPTPTPGPGPGPTPTPGPSAGNSFVYVANQTTRTIAGFKVGTNSTGAGTLTGLPGSPYGLTLPPTAMAITPANKLLYVSVFGGIYAYAIDSSTGALTVLNSGGVVAITTVGEASLDVSPDGQWLFALSQDSSTLEEYQINAATGALALVANPIRYVGAGNMQAVASMVKVAPNGGFVFLAIGTGGDVVIPFNTRTGALNAIEKSLQLPSGGATTSDNALAVDATTTFLYIARSGRTSGLAVYAIGLDGSLRTVAGSPFAAGQGPFSVVLDSTGKYVYVANRTDSTISGYTIGAGGVLKAVDGSPFASGDAVTSLARESSTKYLLAAAPNGNADLTMYSFDATVPGRLNPAVSAASGTDPAGSFLVVATH